MFQLRGSVYEIGNSSLLQGKGLFKSDLADKVSMIAHMLVSESGIEGSVAEAVEGFGVGDAVEGSGGC